MFASTDFQFEMGTIQPGMVKHSHLSHLIRLGLRLTLVHILKQIIIRVILQKEPEHLSQFNICDAEKVLSDYKSMIWYDCM